MESGTLFIANPDQELIISTLRQKLEDVQRTSQQHSFTLRMPSGLEAHIAIVVPVTCPPCLYDPKAELSGSWVAVEREELIDALPYPWSELKVDAVDEIIDTIMEYGVGEKGRFMSSGSPEERHCFITSARMICFLHAC